MRRLGRLWSLVHGARNVVAGFLAIYGFVSFFFAIALDRKWAGVAPAEPDPGRGLIYPHSEHGVYTFFSAFQTTAVATGFATSVPLALLAAVVMPKKNLRFGGRGLIWDLDDPHGLMKRAAIAAIFAAPPIFYWCGPRLIHALNDAGVVYGASTWPP